jgi:hypothetical protein
MDRPSSTSAASMPVEKLANTGRSDKFFWSEEAQRAEKLKTIPAIPLKARRFL